MKIRLILDGRTLTATLDDTPTARDFAALLPLRLRLDDYAATEKIADLPRKLTTEGAPAGHTPSAGDLAYYAPWGNLAIFHRDFRYSERLVRLGRLEGDLAALRAPGALNATLERIEAAGR
ncbi:cyclophilin-like fold protein [Derxia lacustris]|uniref:cyclophilin-like fold protein n=1 Tax=Derxia lacustris TaxID=764842 RepID=UPI000A176CB3|nr:cyclophilin-like fold protein [Derxia lacustris]